MEKDYNNFTEEEKRIFQLRMEIEGLKTPEEIMQKIVEIFKNTFTSPEAGKYYTFTYLAKTPNIIYDKHPLVAVLSVYDWGFSGINFHWNEIKRYTWTEIVGQLHLITNKEVEYLKSVAYAKYIHK